MYLIGNHRTNFGYFSLVLTKIRCNFILSKKIDCYSRSFTVKKLSKVLLPQTVRLALPCVLVLDF